MGWPLACLSIYEFGLEELQTNPELLRFWGQMENAWSALQDLDQERGDPAFDQHQQQKLIEVARSCSHQAGKASCIHVEFTPRRPAEQLAERTKSLPAILKETTRVLVGDPVKISLIRSKLGNTVR